MIKTDYHSMNLPKFEFRNNKPYRYQDMGSLHKQFDSYRKATSLYRNFHKVIFFFVLISNRENIILVNTQILDQSNKRMQIHY